MPGLNGFDRAAGKEDRLHAKRYDAWFKSLPKEQQDKLREEGAGPYCEARTHDHVFPVYERAAIWAYTPDVERTEQDAFISREQVGRIVADVVEMLGYTRDPKVRRHWELMRLVLRAPGHLNGKEIGKLFGVTKQAISIQATGMLARIDARRRMKEALPFLIEDALPFAAADDKPAPVAISCVITPRARAPRAKESLRPPTPSVAWRNTPGEKKGGFGRISKIGKRPRKKAK
jgi:hypothetical protein